MLEHLCATCGRLAYRCVCAGLGVTIGLGTILPSQLSDLPAQAASVPIVSAATNASVNSGVAVIYNTVTDREITLPRPETTRTLYVEHSGRATWSF
jgi:hypothetical protein